MTLLSLSLLGACFQENLPQVDIRGTVVVPQEAVTRETPIVDENGVVTGSQTLTDIRLMGPVYLGAYSGIDNASLGFPYPAMGPIITDDAPGNAFPYGGTSLGRFDYACYEFLACKVSTGRFRDYDDIIDYFANVVGRPVVDDHGNLVESSDTFQQACYEYFHITSDQELAFLGADEFTQNSDGDFVAEFVMPHTTLVPGMSLWGFMDAPIMYADQVGENGGFSTCNPNIGTQRYVYDNEIYEGATQPDVLNLPLTYLTYGDWVADGQAVVETEADRPQVTLNVMVQQ